MHTKGFIYLSIYQLMGQELCENSKDNSLNRSVVFDMALEYAPFLRKYRIYLCIHTCSALDRDQLVDPYAQLSLCKKWS